MARPTGCCAVTGGGGFIGRHIVEACLSEFDAVRSVDLVASTQSAAELHIADINEPDQLSAALRGCTAVIHCAGIVDTRSGRLHEQRIHRGNVAGTAAVIEACRREAVEVLVFVSSHSAVSDGVWGDDGGALRGEGNASAYGRSKLAAERAVVAAHEAAGGLSTVCVRPQIVFGPGDPLFTNELLLGAAPPPLLGDGRTMHTPIYVKNLAGQQVKRAAMTRHDSQGLARHGRAQPAPRASICPV
jgi:nucleoside-diphosphate-sugar epimerase